MEELPWPAPCNRCSPAGSWTLLQQATIDQSSAPGVQMRGNPPLGKNPLPALHHTLSERKKTPETASGSGTAASCTRSRGKAGEEPGSCVPLPNGRARWMRLHTQTQPEDRRRRRAHPSRSRQSRTAAKQQLLAGWLHCGCDACGLPGLLGCNCIVSVCAVARPACLRKELKEDRIGKGFRGDPTFVTFWVAGCAGQAEENTPFQPSQCHSFNQCDSLPTDRPPSLTFSQPPAYHKIAENDRQMRSPAANR